MKNIIFLAAAFILAGGIDHETEAATIGSGGMAAHPAVGSINSNANIGVDTGNPGSSQIDTNGRTGTGIGVDSGNPGSADVNSGNVPNGINTNANGMVTVSPSQNSDASGNNGAFTNAVVGVQGGSCSEADHQSGRC